MSKIKNHPVLSPLHHKARRAALEKGKQCSGMRGLGPVVLHATAGAQWEDPWGWDIWTREVLQVTELSQGPPSWWETLLTAWDIWGPVVMWKGAHMFPRTPFSPSWLARLIWVAGSRIVCLWEAGLGPGERTARSCGKVTIYSLKKKREI